jgi:hypothetical protein
MFKSLYDIIPTNDHFTIDKCVCVCVCILVYIYTYICIYSTHNTNRWTVAKNTVWLRTALLNIQVVEVIIKNIYYTKSH